MRQNTGAPLIPDGDEARQWAETELSKQRYAEAKPTFFDEVSRAVVDFFVNLFSGEGGASFGPAAMIVVAVLIVGALIGSLIIWGRPRRSFSRPSTAVDLLGSDDRRSATQLRSDAERAAKSNDWDSAIALRYRALVRALLERDLLSPAPGATAQILAREAAIAFPAEQNSLRNAAAIFDDVRYLKHPGNAERYRELVATDTRLQSSRPELVAA